MSFLSSLNKKLDKLFDGQVAADEERGCLVLSGELERWNDIVFAGKLAAQKNPYFGLINEIECTGEPPLPVRKPRVDDSALEWEEPDVLIIGGGVIGCAVARELSRYELSILLIEKEHDLALHASGRNSGIVHSGLGLGKGTQRSKYCKLGNSMFGTVCSELGVEFNRCGQYVTLARRMWEPFLSMTKLYWKWLGLKGVKIVKRDEFLRYEPDMNRDIGKALHFPSSGVVDPFDLTIAYAENAVQNGAFISFDTMVKSIVTEDGNIKSVTTNRGTIKPRVVVNAAGVFCEQIAAMAGDHFYSIHPRKGTTVVLDKKYASDLVRSVITTLGATSARKKHTRDGSLSLSTGGTVLVGPDDIETIQKEDFSTAAFNIKELFAAHSRAVPALDEEQMITYFSGVRAATYEEDFVVCPGRSVLNLIHAAGIQVPGLTAAPAIGVDVAKMVVELFGGDKNVKANAEFDPIRTAPLRLADMDDEARSEMIKSNSDYGIIICKCEEVSKGEILNTLRRNVKCDTVDGVKRRVRTGMGRCQGSCCAPQIVDIIATEKRFSPQSIKKGGSGSELLYGSTKILMRNKTAAEDKAFSIMRTDPTTAAIIQKRADAMHGKKPSGKENVTDDGN